MEKSLQEFIDAIDNEVKRADCIALIKLMEAESGYKASLHGKVFGFGLYHFVYESGRCDRHRIYPTIKRYLDLHNARTFGVSERVGNAGAAQAGQMLPLCEETGPRG